MKHFLLYTGLGAALLLSSCSKYLDLQPTNAYTAERAYNSGQNYYEAAAKIYAANAVAGNGGPNDGNSTDIPGTGDGGSSEFIRNLFNAQELPTDEAVNGWVNDPGLFDYHNMNWTAGNPWIRRIYSRSGLSITLANEFIRQADPAVVASRGITNADTTAQIADFRNEVRFLRAMNYAVLMDCFGSPFFITDAERFGTQPRQISRADLFKWLEAELVDLGGRLKPARSGVSPDFYGRADQAAAWALLSRLYLNAEVYKGEAEYANAAKYAKMVIDAGYTLHKSTINPNNSYREMFMADNNVTCRDEFIWTINYDGTKTQTYGGTTYLAHSGAPSISSMRTDFGFTNAWQGNRATQTLVNLLGDTLDQRSKLLYTKRQILPVVNAADVTQGAWVSKFRNVTSTGAIGSDPTVTFLDTDFPYLRVSEMYLIYAEAAARGAGDQAMGLQYLNDIRNRAYGANTAPSITVLTPEVVLDERARELFWECQRRTDLVRFNRFTSNTYQWDLKGGDPTGAAVIDPARNLYPIPGPELLTNSNLKQNTGY